MESQRVRHDWATKHPSDTVYSCPQRTFSSGGLETRIEGQVCRSREEINWCYKNGPIPSCKQDALRRRQDGGGCGLESDVQSFSGWRSLEVKLDPSEWSPCPPGKHLLSAGLKSVLSTCYKEKQRSQQTNLPGKVQSPPFMHTSFNLSRKQRCLPVQTSVYQMHLNFH